MPFIEALRGSNHTGTIPCWFMRQAGRYLPSYQKIRSRYSLSHMFYDEELIVKITQLPLNEFPLDAAIVFSDILLVLETLGCRVSYIDGVGPRIDVKRDHDGYPLFEQCLDVNDYFSFLKRAIVGLKEQLDVPLIGFVGGPYTVLSYLFKDRKLPNDRKRVDLLLKQVNSKIEQLALLQEEAGVDAFQIFDTWAGHLPDDLYHRYSLDPCKKIALNIPTLYFSLNAGKRARMILDNLEPTGISLSDKDCLVKLREIARAQVVLQGNLDPKLVLHSKKEAIKEVKRIKEVMKSDPAFIFNFSHGVLPKTPVENIRAIFEELKR